MEHLTCLISDRFSQDKLWYLDQMFKVLSLVSAHYLITLESILYIKSTPDLFGFLATASCRNTGKDCIHKTKRGRTLHKQELRAPGCPFFFLAIAIFLWQTVGAAWKLANS
jgi:hypothetical protein